MWKHLLGAFNQEKILVGALSVIVKLCLIFRNIRLKVDILGTWFISVSASALPISGVRHHLQPAPAHHAQPLVAAPGLEPPPVQVLQNIPLFTGSVSIRNVHPPWQHPRHRWLHRTTRSLNKEAHEYNVYSCHCIPYTRTCDEQRTFTKFSQPWRRPLRTLGHWRKDHKEQAVWLA